MKFKVGEIVILATSAIPDDPDVGRECEIIALPRGHAWTDSAGCIIRGDCYIIKTGTAGRQGDYLWATSEWRLRKRPQPGIPESILRIFEVELKQEKPA